MKNRLTIISVPNQRQIRVLMGNHILDPLLSISDIVIVAPFANNKDFKLQFAKQGLSFLEWHPPENKGSITDKLYNISEMLRMHGYWFRHRKNGMFAYLLFNSLAKHGKNNQLLKLPLWKRAIYFIIYFFGAWPRSWQILDLLVAPKLFNYNQLIDLSSQYSDITLIQSSSWGMQDRMLSWNAKKVKWKKILLPYTTDQLYMNGYLMSDFDFIFAQGPTEESYAKNLHGINDCKIIPLGSSWFRMIDAVQSSKQQIKNIQDNRKVIIYAGSQSEFFSTESEFQGLDLLLDAIKLNKLKDVRIIYRPIPISLDIVKKINLRYSGQNNLEIQYPDHYSFGLSTYSANKNLEPSVHDHISQLVNADLMVMCFVTSLCLDAAYLGVPTISYCVDNTGYLEKRKTDLVYQGNWAGLDHIPHVINEQDFIPLVKQMLVNKKFANDNHQLTVKKWDFPKESFNENFLKAIS